MLERLKSWVGLSGMQAGTAIPTPPPPKKVPNAQTVMPSYLTTAKPSPTSPLLLKDRQLANTDITTLRAGASSRAIIRDFVRSSPDLSATVSAYIRTGITDSYTAAAKNPDGTYNPEATAALQQIIARIDVLPDYTIGYDDAPTLRSLSETLGRELIMYGSMCGELVLDKTRLPYKIQPLSTTQIKWYPSADAKRVIPQQVLAGQYIPLDMPTFFSVSLDQDTLDAYSQSPIEPAIQAVLFSADFMNDIRRVVKKAIHPRVVVTINEEKFRNGIPPDVRADEAKLADYMATVISNVRDSVNGLEPEDALVVFDSIGIEITDHGNTNLSNEYEVIQSLIDSKMSTGAKALPTVLGHANSTANAASTETLLFIKYVQGTVTAKLNEFYSKVFTLAVRLMGFDVYVKFEYASIEMKPPSELEAFFAMKQSRILMQLSLGLITDEEACIQLTGHLPPAGYTPKSGTNFMSAATATAAPAGDGYNGATNSGSAANQNTKPTTPTNAKSQNKGKPGNP
jgi:hypothetical protein